MYIGDTSDGTDCITWCSSSGQRHRRGPRWLLQRYHGNDTHDNSISVSDNGRGIPTGNIRMTNRGARRRNRHDELHAGGKFDNNSYKISGGLHGVGVSVVNALSEWLRLTIRREGKAYSMEFRDGVRSRR